MVKLSDWSECHPKIEPFNPEILIHWNSREHLWSTLRVSDVGNFLSTCLISNEINLGWSIVLSHFSERVLPIGFISLWVQSGMVRAILSASLVAEPDIVPVPHQLECWGGVVVVHDPAVCWVSNTMLQEHNRSALKGFIWGDSEHI